MLFCDKRNLSFFLFTFLLSAMLGCSPPPNDPPGEPPESAENKLLSEGDQAPALSIAKWMTGEPLESWEPGRVYVVEFWATWCGPCLGSMPHLSALQDQYGDDVTFIGVTMESETTVRFFLQQPQSQDKTWGEAVTYRLAIDSDNKTTQAYMDAAGQYSIPTAFIIGKDGAVAWIGHPLDMDQPLSRIAGQE